MDAKFDIDPGFEPQTRARSNTWPLPRPENYIEKDGDDKTGVGGASHESGIVGNGVDGGGQPGGPKKNSSRRNAWGNMSYADLITQAIQSSPEKRLTLSQIYDWMVQNVSYFKDKGDSNSSAGWKNSIRHNLSLHNRFMRVQNEGTGKSSWWMINPDAKPGKAARRRTGSMDTQKFEKKRGRVKKKVEALRNGLDTTPSPSSSVSEGLDIFPESPIHTSSFQLSPQDFRPRASSNASSCSRLSPIPAVEADMHETQVPPLSPIPWNAEMTNMYGPSVAQVTDRYGTDQLVDSLAESIKLVDTVTDALNMGDNGALKPQMNLPNNGFSMNQYYRNYTELGHRSPQTVLEQPAGPPQLPPPSYSLVSMSGMPQSPLGETSPNPSPYCPPPGPPPGIPEQEMLRTTSKASPPSPTVSSSLGNTANQLMGSLVSLNNPLPNDLDLNLDTLHGGLECDVDQVIQHELRVDGNLDFNFSLNEAAAAASASVNGMSRPWVH